MNVSSDIALNMLTTLPTNPTPPANDLMNRFIRKMTQFVKKSFMSHLAIQTH